MIVMQLDVEQLNELIRRSIHEVLKDTPPPTLTLAEQSDQLLTVQETAEFLHVTVPTIYTQVSRGELPVMKRNKRLYFSKAELVDYLKAGRKKTLSEIETESEVYISTRKKRLNDGK